MIGTRCAAALASSALVAGCLVAFAAPASADTVVRITDGTDVPFVVPAHVTMLHVTLIGGSGASTVDFLGDTIPGGTGAELQADLRVRPGTKIRVYVGGTAVGDDGGINGGGSGIESIPDNGGGGGGATDIRIGGNDLGDRKLVAGGGGGAAFTSTGGDAGQPGVASTCGDGQNPAQPGTDTAGGAGGSCDGVNGDAGVFGAGGNGKSAEDAYAGGGGGGWFGGGGGSTASGGAGGSSHATSSAKNVSVTIPAAGTAPSVTFSYLLSSTLTVSATPKSVPANGKATTLVTAHATDKKGTPVPGEHVVFRGSQKGVRFGKVKDHGDGTYSVTMIAGKAAGKVTVTATSTTSGAKGTVVVTLTKLANAVTFTSKPPKPAKVGAHYTARATGRASTPVTFTTSTSAVCHASGKHGQSIAFEKAGTCTVVAHQDGDSQYSAAEPVSQKITVRK